MKKKVISFILMVVVLLTFIVPAYAEEVRVDPVENLKRELGIEDEQVIKDLCTVFAVVSTQYGDAFAAGICANILAESGGRFDTVEAATGNGVGLVQWTGIRRVLFSEFCREYAYETRDVSGKIIQVSGGKDELGNTIYVDISDGGYVTRIGDVTTQALFILAELSQEPVVIDGVDVTHLRGSARQSSFTVGGAWENGASYANADPNTFPYARGQYEKATGNTGGIPFYRTIQEAAESNDVCAISLNIVSIYERPSRADKSDGRPNDRAERTIRYAQAVYGCLAGKDISKYVDMYAVPSILGLSQDENILSRFCGVYMASENPIEWKPNTGVVKWEPVEEE